MINPKFIGVVANDVAVSPQQVGAAIALFDAGASIPFVARYCKDLTGGLDEPTLERIALGNARFSAMEQRRKAILDNIEKQGRLTDELRAAIDACLTKYELEDVYLPFKKRRRTKATAAIEQGLGPLARHIERQEDASPPLIEVARQFVNFDRAVLSPEAALDGAREILAEQLSLDAGIRRYIRERMLTQAKVASRSTKLAEGKKTKFEVYYAFAEPLNKIPSHRFLAILRGVKEGFLRMDLELDDDALLAELLKQRLTSSRPDFEEQWRLAIDDAYKRILRPAIENEVVTIARERADADAIRVFRENAESLLLAPPAGPIPVVGLNPGAESGCIAAVIDASGAFKESALFQPSQGEEAEERFVALLKSHGAYAVAVGNGAGARDAAAFAQRALKRLNDHRAFAVVVNEAGASVYASSKLGREEFPDLEGPVRAAISIARRLQDPLAELVKIESRSIGVGQYQHDVNQKMLREGLHRTVVSCVNKVGADLNTAPVTILRYISGIQYGAAQNIVAWRTQHGPFKNRRQLLEVDGIGPKVFEQCAAFLRVRGDDNPLDATAIHPEAYPVVEKIAQYLETDVKSLIGNRELLDKCDLSLFVTNEIGPLALEDIRKELIQPHQDPRGRFKPPKLIVGARAISELEPGMELEGVVTNVTNFGAFIDVGVQQDGLVHLSELAHHFVHDPREVVTVGQVVKVKVIGLDKELPRISLSIKALQPPRPKKRRKPKRPEAAAGAAAELQAPAPAPAQRARDRKPRPRRETAGAALDKDRPEKSKRDDRGNGRPAKTRDKERERDREPRRRRDKERDPSHEQRKPRHIQLGDNSGPLNTQLADQLAGLREKLSSGQ